LCLPDETVELHPEGRHHLEIILSASGGGGLGHLYRVRVIAPCDAVRAVIFERVALLERFARQQNDRAAAKMSQGVAVAYHVAPASELLAFAQRAAGR
jgi:hypothetical protein